MRRMTARFYDRERHAYVVARVELTEGLAVLGAVVVVSVVSRRNAALVAASAEAGASTAAVGMARGWPPIPADQVTETRGLR